MAAKIIEEYIEAAIQHGEGTISGDYKKTNLAYGKLIALYKKMLADKNYAFEDLFSHKNDSVKVWSATHSLPFIPKKACKVLKKVSIGKGCIALGALIVLQEYEKGSLKIDGYHTNSN